RDRLLTDVSIYWLTATAGSSARLYYEDANEFPPVWRSFPWTSRSDPSPSETTTSCAGYNEVALYLLGDTFLTIPPTSNRRRIAPCAACGAGTVGPGAAVHTAR